MLVRFFSRLIPVLPLTLALTVSGCSYIPWIGDDQKEEDLAFEQEFGDPNQSAFEDQPPAESSNEDAFFADDAPSQGGFEDPGFNDPGFSDSGAGSSGGFDAPPPDSGGFAGVSQGATAGELRTDVETLQAQQEALITRVRELQEIIQTMEPRLAATQSRLETSLGSVSGTGESVQPEIERLKAEVSNLNQEIARLKAQEGTMRTASAAAPRKAATRRMAPSSSKLPAAYTRALDAYRKGDYDGSILQFQQFAEKGHPPDHLKDNIHFWLGSSYYQLDMFDDAIAQFQSVIDNFPRGNKIHDSRYMLGLTLFKKGDRGRAMDVLETALKTNPPAEVRDKIQKQLMEIK